MALDVPLEKGLSLYERIRGHVAYAKVGLSLFVEHGPRAVQAFRDRGAEVFLDLKLHDIPNTVELAAARAGALGVAFLTVHASGGEAMLRAAAKGAGAGAASRGHPAPRLLAVTVLTSLSAEEVVSVGWPTSAEEAASRLARLSVRAGVPGLVCSAQEAARMRAELGRDVFLCTPGIRPAGTSAGDQRRAATPGDAVRAGADLLVVGRPLSGAQDPEAVARALWEEVTNA